jgi:hypothetical protein
MPARCRMTAAAAVFCLYTAGLAAQEVPTAAVVARLVEQLDAATLTERQNAIRQLEAFGPALLPLLPDAAEITAPGPRDAVEQLRLRLERELTLTSVRAATITHSGASSADDSLAAIAQQTGNRLSAVPPFSPQPTVTASWRQTPFWTAAGEFAQQTQRQIVWQRERERFELIPVGMQPVELAASVFGPFRVVVHSPEWRQTGAIQLLRLTCVVQAEPRLQPLFVRWPLRDWGLSAGQQTALPWNPDAAYELPFPDRTSEVSLPVDFHWHPSPPDREWTLSGQCLVTLAAGREPLTFAGSQLRRGVVVRRNGVSARMQDVRFESPGAGPASGRVRIAVNYERGGPAFESHRMGLFHRSAWLIGDNGEQVPFSGLEVTAEADGGLAVEYRFDQLQPPVTQYRFVYEAPTLLVEVPVTVRTTLGPLMQPPAVP